MTAAGANIILFSTGRGTPNYKYHFTDYTDVKRLHNFNALYINDTVNVYSPDYYTWIKYDTETPDLPPILKTSKFKWVLYANKIRNKRTFN